MHHRSTLHCSSVIHVARRIKLEAACIQSRNNFQSVLLWIMKLNIRAQRRKPAELLSASPVMEKLCYPGCGPLSQTKISRGYRRLLRCSPILLNTAATWMSDRRWTTFGLFDFLWFFTNYVPSQRMENSLYKNGSVCTGRFVGFWET